MKRYIHLIPLLFIIGPLAWSWFHSGFYQVHDKSDKIMFCVNFARTKRALPSSLISNSYDSEDQVLCPGDSFGDLDNTYVTIKSCYLEMYHQEKLIWSSKNRKEINGNPCAFSLQRDGNLVLYREGVRLARPGGRMIYIDAIWESYTNFHPLKTELRLQNQQVQIVQTWKDGTQRVFYADANHQGFRENIGEPRKVASRFLFKSHKDEDKTILKRNEYIGDLNGTHLILQTDCDLQLLNKKRIIWSFSPSFRHGMDCVFSVQEGNQIGISTKKSSSLPLKESIIIGEPLDALRSQIILEEDQLMILQTLENGTELMFRSEPGQNNGLKLHKEPRQIAKDVLKIPEGEYLTKIERMDYIGNLTGLHLILQDNCTFVLLNGNEKLWELHEEPRRKTGPLMDCYIQVNRYRPIEFEKLLNNQKRDREVIFGKQNIEGIQLALENNRMIITLEHKHNAPPEIYHADRNTRGTWFQFISEGSLMVDSDDDQDKILPEMSYIGDLNGVYVMLEDSCNWVLYNKSQVVWESGTPKDNTCVVILKRNGSLVITYEYSKENYFYSTENITRGNDVEGQILKKTEILVNNDGMWLRNDYADGTVKNFKAQEGTNSFIHVPNEEPLGLTSD